MNIERARSNMIAQQIRTWDVLDENVLQALVAVQREAFVPEAYRKLAFIDTEIPLPCGEFMLSPKLEARLLQAAALAPNDQVLEIGTGSGYMAALVAQLAQHVVSVEIEPELAALAAAQLTAYGIHNVRVMLGDGAKGWFGESTQLGPFDVIMLSGSVPVLPLPLQQQVKIGGRIVAVIGEAPIMSACVVTRTAQDAWDTVKLFETSVRPLRNAERTQAFRF
jgi:protein-L-isoaspartate(D-aspartate) O-methyltransferase